ncbi:MAG: chlororespiratory reduction protein 7 [Cyanobacteria bacterium P01_H01_bin.121]
MPDAIMYEEDYYVLLKPGAAEQFLMRSELLAMLEELAIAYADELPRDAARLPTPREQAQHLLDTSCELNTEPGQTVQWYAVRLEK